MAAKIAAGQMVRVKRRASEELTPIPRIYQEEVAAAQQAGMADEVAAFLPNFQGCSSSAYRTRAQRFPILPERREDIVLEGEWAQTADHQNFVLANNSEAEKLIIFGSIEGLLQVCRANTVYMDGTFFAAPRLFAQLYTVHAKVYGQMFPLLYGLLPNKTEETYGRFINFIEAAAVENDVQFDPDTIMVDFEVASIQAYQRVLPRSAIKGCLFHYGQCVQRCIQRVGLAAAYRAADLGSPLRRMVRRTSARPLVPPDQLDLVWENIMHDAPANPETPLFQDYVENTWIGDGARFERDLWNQYHRIAESRTNNALEGWHHKVNLYLGKAHPNIWEFLFWLRKEELFQRGELQRLEAGGVPNPRRLAYVRVDDRLSNLKLQYQNGQRDVMSYADAVDSM